MTLSHRSIAVQGLGFPRAHIALQGFVRRAVAPPWPGGGGGPGGSSSTPRRYVHSARLRRRREELLFILKP